MLGRRRLVLIGTPPELLVLSLSVSPACFRGGAGSSSRRRRSTCLFLRLRVFSTRSTRPLSSLSAEPRRPCPSRLLTRRGSPRTPSTRRQEDAETCRGGPWIPLVCGCPLTLLAVLAAGTPGTDRCQGVCDRCLGVYLTKAGPAHAHRIVRLLVSYMTLAPQTAVSCFVRRAGPIAACGLARQPLMTP